MKKESGQLVLFPRRKPSLLSSLIPQRSLTNRIVSMRRPSTPSSLLHISDIRAIPWSFLKFFSNFGPQILEKDGEGNKHMKTITKFIYPAVKTATRKLAAFAALLVTLRNVPLVASLPFGSGSPKPGTRSRPVGSS